MTLRLNPFENREGFEQTEEAAKNLNGVLIPLRTGKGSNTVERRVILVWNSLNPFENREGFELMPKVGQNHICRLNPFENREGFEHLF